MAGRAGRLAPGPSRRDRPPRRPVGTLATVELSLRAVENLDRLSTSLSLPTDTPDRVRRILAELSTFPQLGRELEGRWRGFRVLLGPWRWMLFVYRIDEPTDRIVVVTIQDARTSMAVTGNG